jgi:hypothetical protein
MIVPVCDRPSLAEPTGPYGDLLWSARERQCTGNCGRRDRQLPITGFAHKAGVVGDAVVAAILAALNMAAEGRRAALLDRRHHLELVEAHMPGIGSAPGGPMAMKDVCDLQFWAAHGRPGYSPVVGLPSVSGASRSSGLVTVRIVALATRV